MKVPDPEKEHRWLQQFVGDWTFTVEAPGKPGGPPMQLAGEETVRAIGGLWIVADAKGEMPGGGTAVNQLTLGYDTLGKRFVGTWIGSIMSYLWVYSGSLDATGNKLTLDTEGPAMNPRQSGFTKYRDTMERVSDDVRIFTSTMLGADGMWTEIMTSHYRRKHLG